MKLIADSGSSKTDWAFLCNDGSTVRFVSTGYNPNYITMKYMVDDITASFPNQLSVCDVSDIYFFGAGVTEMQYDFVKKALKKVFTKVSNIFVSMDTLGAAKALLGNNPGFALILGTGTNSCIYDGKKITMNIDSLGFILGDEGSGAYIGKRLIVDYVRGKIPQEIYPLVKENIRMDGDQLIDEIYTKPFPNRFCAQYAKFVKEHINVPYFYNLVKNAFIALFEAIISQYPNYFKYRLDCVGSIAFSFREILTQVAKDYNMEVGTIIQYPIEGLINYYREND